MTERKPLAIFKADEEAVIKAISVKQPFASFIADGSKTIETRSWPTKHRGDLLICTSKKLPTWVTPNDSEIYSSALGKAICVVNLVDCRPMTSDDEIAAKCKVPPYVGAYSWVLEDVRQIAPFDQKGQLGLFNVPMSGLKFLDLKMYVDNTDCDFVIASSPDEAKLLWCMHYDHDPADHDETSFEEYGGVNFTFSENSSHLGGATKMTNEWIAIRGKGWFATSQH